MVWDGPPPLLGLQVVCFGQHDMPTKSRGTTCDKHRIVGQCCPLSTASNTTLHTALHCCPPFTAQCPVTPVPIKAFITCHASAYASTTWWWCTVIQCTGAVCTGMHGGCVHRHGVVPSRRFYRFIRDYELSTEASGRTTGGGHRGAPWMAECRSEAKIDIWANRQMGLCHASPPLMPLLCCYTTATSGNAPLEPWLQPPPEP